MMDQRIVVGLPNANFNGMLRVYEWNINDSKWNQLGNDIMNTLNEHVGFSVSINADGTRIASGNINPYKDYDSGILVRTGNTKIFHWDNEQPHLGWVQLGNDIPGELLNDNQGYSVSLSGDGSIVAVGSNELIIEEVKLLFIDGIILIGKI